MSKGFFYDHLELLCGSLTQQESSAAIKTLTKIVQNALNHPGEERYRQLTITNKMFNTKIWKHACAQEFMTAIGWAQVDGTVVLLSDDLLPDALAALTNAQSLIDSRQGAAQAPTESESTHNSTTSQLERDAYQEQMRKMREDMRKAELERKRIAEQIKADRRETNQRRAQASHSTHIPFGSRMTTFSDIGVDLNRGGG